MEGLIKKVDFKAGFTLIEVMIDILVVAVVSAAVLAAYSASFKSIELARAKITSVALANERMEELRNLPYDDLATESGAIYPPGDIVDNEELVRHGIKFNVHIVISYIDDSYDGNVDGTIAGKPQDLYPYDYKKAEVTISKVGMNGHLSRLTSNFSAKAAETPGNSGIIKLCVVDASDQPLSGANIEINNPNVSPPVAIQAVTGIDGCVMIPNLPPDEHNNYNLKARKDGYSIDATYPRTAQNPNALFPDVNVLAQQVTVQTLKIDKLSRMIINVKDTQGQPVINQQVHIESVKEIYFNPSTPKFVTDVNTDSSGSVELTDMEFGEYNITIPGSSTVSTSPYQPVGLSADSTLAVNLVITSSGSHPIISSAEPITGITNQPLSIALIGDNFVSGTSAKLINSLTSAEINGTVSINNKFNIDIDLDLTGADLGFWDIEISNSGGTVRQLNGLEIVNGT